jgi:hypothetical protein
MAEVIMAKVVVAVPKGWSEDLPEMADSFREEPGPHGRFSNRYLTPSGHDTEEVTQWVMLDKVLPLQPPVMGISTGVSTRMEQDGLRLARNTETGYLICKVAPGYFSFWKPKEGFESADICGYCGEDTTDMRQGWDCGHCGCN